MGNGGRWCLGLLTLLCICLDIAHPSVFKFEQTDEHVRQDKAPATCGYENCLLGRDDMLNVHLVAHTHDDVGWLDTVDGYYYKSVQYIIDTVISELRKDPEKRFIYVEMAFFWRWWNEQDDSMRHAVKGLVNKGRLEFILGGWSMNDEGSTHYAAIIDQHTAGFTFLERTFGHCAIPKIGWQIDPFGHSREQASIFAQFGFDGLFFSRLDYQDKDKRLRNKTMELMWMGSANLGRASSSLFTGVMPDGYGPPPSIQAQDPIRDDERLEDYDVDKRVEEFIKAAVDQAKHFTTNHIMMTMGEDFQFQNAHENFKNLDKFIRYVNEAQAKGSKVNTFYSTPSCYLYALNRANQTYTSKSDDFFPYASDAHTLFTGYFTSRPAFKGYVRECNNFFQNVKQLDTLSQLEAEHGSNIKIDILREAMGVSQHHDAVSGTEKQAVADDYAKRLARGVVASQEVVNSAYSKLMPRTQTPPPAQSFCNLLNVSYCSASEDNDQFTVTLYNPVGRPVNFWVRVPVTKSTYTVLAPNMDKVANQIVPVSDETKNIPAHSGSKATGELVFLAELPALGFKAFFVLQSAADDETLHCVEAPDGDVIIKNEHVSLTFDSDTILLKSMSNLDKGLTQAMSQDFLYYISADGNDSKPEFQPSGAYIFRPKNNTAVDLGTCTSVKMDQFTGDLVLEVHQTFNEWTSQVVRLYKGEKYAEFEWTVGPIPYEDKIGKEIISRFTTGLDNQKTFYTDANGREILKRVRDFRPTWTLNQTEEVAGNYYPVNSRIYIRDETKKTQFTVLTDRSQGGASILDGQLELMVHRRLFVDDGFGVGEALNETGITGKGLVVRGKHYVILDTIDDSAALHRDLAQRLFMAPTVSFADLTGTPQEYVKKFKAEWSGLKTALPPNVHLLTMEQWKAATFLLRLEHFYEKGEDATLSKPATVSLRGLFVPFEVKSVVELTLGANQLLDEARRLQWNVEDYGRTGADMSDCISPVNPTTLDVVLEPMQIRTFEVHIFS